MGFAHVRGYSLSKRAGEGSSSYVSRIVGVYPVVARLALLGAIRGGTAVVSLGAAIAAGAEARAALLAFALGAAGSAVLLASDRRSRFRAPSATEPLPRHAARASWPRAVAGGLWPSTYGVAVFAAVALAFDATLAALLAGILGGMAVASVLSVARIAAEERRERVRYYGRLAEKRVFTSPRETPARPREPTS